MATEPPYDEVLDSDQPTPRSPRFVDICWSAREREAFAKLCAELDVDTDEPLAGVLNEAAEEIAWYREQATTADRSIEGYEASNAELRRRISRAVGSLLWPLYTPEERKLRVLDHLGYVPPAGLEGQTE